MCRVFVRMERTKMVTGPGKGRGWRIGQGPIFLLALKDAQGGQME